MPLHSPDVHADGLLPEPLDSLRYDGQSDHPMEVAGVLKSFMPSKVRVLDIGCGTGSVTLIANRGKDNHVLGVEPDPDRARMANRRGIDCYNGLFDREFVERNEKFDVVMFADVLEHLPAPSSMLDLAIEALRADGVILASVPNVAHWSVRTQLLFGNFEYEATGIMDATHLRWFTERSLIQLFEERGLRVIKVRQTAGVGISPYWRRPYRWIPGRIRWPLVRQLTKVLPRLFGCQHVLIATRKAAAAP